MSRPDKVRFSKLDALAYCPSSLVQSEGQPNVGSDASAEGTAVHAAFAQLGKVRDPCAVDYAAIGRTHAVEADYIREVVIDSRYVPPEGSESEVHVVLELGNGLPSVEGTADLIVPSECAVLDFKVTQLRGDAPDVGERLQVLGYGAAVALGRGWFSVSAQVFNPLMGYPRGIQKLDVDPSKILAEIRFIVRRAMEQYDKPADKREYRTGPACSFCPGRSTCPAANAALTALSPVLNADVLVLPPREQLAPACFAVRDMKKRIEAFEDAVNALLDAEPGREIVANGLVLARRSKMVKPSKSFPKAMEQLRERGMGEVAAEIEAYFDSLPKIETFSRYLGKEKAVKS